MSASDHGSNPSDITPLPADADTTIDEVGILQLGCVGCSYFLNKICVISKISYCVCQ